jgi:hypothetical protein
MSLTPATISGILDAAGLTGFLTNVSALRERVDVEKSASGCTLLMSGGNGLIESGARAESSGVTAGDLFNGDCTRTLTGLPIFGNTAEALAR